MKWLPDQNLKGFLNSLLKRERSWNNLEHGSFMKGNNVRNKENSSLDFTNNLNAGLLSARTQ